MTLEIAGRSNSSGAAVAPAAVGSSEPHRFSPPYDEAAMLAFYNKHGFCLVSGLILDGVCAAAVDEMWQALESPGKQSWFPHRGMRCPVVALLMSHLS